MTATGRMGLTAIALTVIAVMVLIVEASGVMPVHQVSTAAILLCGALVVWKHTLLSFQAIAFVIIFYPALTPIYAWDLRGAELFSWVAQYLQNDVPLITRTVYLFAVGALTYTAVVLPVDRVMPGRPMRGQRVPEQAGPRQVAVLDSGVLWATGLFVVFSAYVIDPGPTILTSNYTEVLEGRIEASTLVVIVTSCFGGFWAALFVFGRQKPWILWLPTAVALLWLFLHARRVEVFGVALILMFWARYKFSARRILTVMAAFVLVQGAVEFIRLFGLIDLLTGRVDTYTLEVAYGLGRVDSLPGGGSNLFLSGLHLVNVRDTSEITGIDTLTMTEWLRAVVPNTIWRLMGAPPVASEHDLIFADLELAYVGGMPLLAAFYLNGGIGLVLIFGVLHGAISNRVERVVHEGFTTSLDIGGRFPLYAAAIFILYQFRYHWYNPQTMVRVLVYSLILYAVFSLFLRYRGAPAPFQDRPGPQAYLPAPERLP